MKYMLLIYNNPATYQAWTEEQRGELFGEVDALMKELTESGELVGGEALADAADGRFDLALGAARRLDAPGRAARDEEARWT